MEGLNVVDLGIIGIFVISSLVGLMRGFFKELLSLITWIAAIFVAVKFSEPLAAAFSGSANGTNNAYISWFAIGISYVVLFVAVMILGAIINFFITSAIRSVGLGFFDRIFGGFFGLARGYFVNLVGVFLIGLTPAAQQPVWMQSQLVLYFQPAVNWIGDQIKPGFDSLKDSMGDTFKNVNDNLHGFGDQLKNIYPVGNN